MIYGFRLCFLGLEAFAFDWISVKTTILLMKAVTKSSARIICRSSESFFISSWKICRIFFSSLLCLAWVVILSNLYPPLFCFLRGWYLTSLWIPNTHFDVSPDWEKFHKTFICSGGRQYSVDWRCFDGTQQETIERSNETLGYLHHDYSEEWSRIQRHNGSVRRLHEHTPKRRLWTHKRQSNSKLWKHSCPREQHTLHNHWCST